MSQPHENQRESAVSPVVAVILLVAITVALSAVVGAFALDLGQQTTNGAAQQSIGTSITYSDGTATATIVTGSADEVRLLVNGTVVNDTSQVSAGTTLTTSATPDDTVSVVVVQDGSARVASSTTVDGTLSSTVPTAGLVAYYPFDGNASDATGNGHGATTTHGTPMYSAGHTNQSVYLDGDDGYYTDWNPTFPNRTISVWFKSSDFKNQTMVWTPDSEGELELRATDKLRGRVFDASPHALTSDGSTSVISGSWHHAVLVVNSTQQAVLYLNGHAVNSTSLGPTQQKTFNVSLGYDEYGRQNAPSADWMNGSIDEVRIYNRTLNSSEVKELYRAEK